MTLCATAAIGAPQKQPHEVARDFRNRSHALRYAGPGRETADPIGADEILLAFFGPAIEEDSAQGDLWCAARLAIDEANSNGGYEGIPFRLASAWSESPWDTGAKHLVNLVYKDRVRAIIGGIDGPSTHLAEQIAAKARLTVVSPISTDKSTNLAGVPWIFSCSAGDHLAAPRLCDAMVDQIGRRPFVLLESNEHDAHHFAVELLKGLSARQRAPAYHLQFRAVDKAADDTRLDRLLVHALRAQPGGVVVVADSVTSGALVKQLAAVGYSGYIFGSPTMARCAFRREAGQAADGVIFPLISTDKSDRKTDKWSAFVSRFKTRYDREPDAAAGKAYDAVCLTIEAVRSAGINRARIRDAIRKLAPWQGVAGEISWDAVGANRVPVQLGTITGGRLQDWESGTNQTP